MWNTPYLINSFPIYFNNLILLPSTHFQPENDQKCTETLIKNQALQIPYQNSQVLQANISQQRPKQAISRPSRYKRLSTKQKYKRKCERQDNFQRKKQKKDRNLPSNIFKYFFQYISAISANPLFLKATTPSQTHFCVHQLVLKLKLIAPLNKVYISPRLVKSLCYSDQLPEHERLLFRILLFKFLTTEGPILIVGRNNLKRSQKMNYLRACRKLRSQIYIQQPKLRLQ